MEAPQCKNKKYENFTVDKKLCKTNKIHGVFSSVALKNWCDFHLIVPNIAATDSSASFKKYSESLELISQKLIRHPYVQDYAFRVKKHLKSNYARASYDQAFEEEQQKVERQKSKKRLNHANELLSHAELTLESTENLAEVTKRIKLVKDSMAVVHGESSAMAISTEEVSAKDNSAPIEDDTDAADTTKVTEATEATKEANTLNARKNVQSTIYDAGKELHSRYKAGYKLNFAQMKTMKCGLSNILDLSEQDKQFSQRRLFSSDIWGKLTRKYSRFKLSPPASIESLNDKWQTISDLCIANKDSLLGKKYISMLESSQAATTSQLRVLDLFREVIYLVDSRSFMLNQDNKAKISERDFSYQLWLPIFQKIFHVNNEIIRIKVGETVLSESTESKASVYTNSSNIVGFKVDMRFILDFETEEFDLACAEACIPVSLEAKIQHDMSKLLREGKIMQASSLNVIEDSSVYSWVLQISGPSCSFYTVHNTKHQYHVCVHQFTVAFPKEYSELPFFLTSLSNILMFRDSVEDTASSIKAAILKTRSNMEENSGASSPSTPTVFESASIYHTPPHRDSSSSQIPEGVYFGELSESELGSSQGSTSRSNNANTDSLGFFHNGEKWTNVLTGKTYSYDPYEL